jgi:hypothetical protein
LVFAWLVSISANPASAQFVELPSYSFFASDSSVLVPDRGGAFLGGVNRASSGSSQFGVPFFPPSRAFGRETSAGGVGVFAQIHDMQELDAAVLARARRQNGRLTDGLGAAELQATPPAAEEQDAGGLASVEELRAREAATRAAIASEAEQLIERARQANASGKSGAARIYLQMAAKRANEPLKSQILAELRSLQPPASLAKRTR